MAAVSFALILARDSSLGSCTRLLTEYVIDVETAGERKGRFVHPQRGQRRQTTKSLTTSLPRLGFARGFAAHEPLSILVPSVCFEGRMEAHERIPWEILVNHGAPTKASQGKVSRAGEDVEISSHGFLKGGYKIN